MHCNYCNRFVRDSDQHNLDCHNHSVRTFQTAADRNAPGGGRTRSHSFDRTRGRSGSFDRMHRHDNDFAGGRKFEHKIGHTDRFGDYTGRDH